MSLLKKELGLIPLGTGNDLARHLNTYNAYVNKGLFFLLRKLLQAPSKAFDLWSLNNQFVMSNYFSAGLDARVAHDFNRDRASGKLKSGSVFRNKIHYLQSFWKDKSHRLSEGSKLSIFSEDEEWVDYDVSKYRTVIIGNIDSFASGANPFRGSDSSDGLLEVVPVKDISRFSGTMLFGSNKHSANLFSKIWLPGHHASKIKLELQENEYLQLDGEDVTGKFPEGKISIEQVSQVRMLYLPPDLYH